MIDNRRDTLRRFLFENTGVRGELVQLSSSWCSMLEGHDYPEAVKGQLGQALAAAVLLSATIKFDGSLLLQAQGQGPLTMVLAQVTNQRTFRGLAHWRGGVEVGTLEEMFGNGRLLMILQPAGEGERYQGIVGLEGRNLAAALHTYFTRSEQLDTALWLAANREVAVGMLLQRLPGEYAQPGAWSRVHRLAATVTEEELLDLPALAIFRRLFPNEDVRVFDPEPVRFQCACTQGRAETAVRALGRTDALDLVRERGKIEANCEFCNKRYALDAVDVERVFSQIIVSEISETRH